VYSIFCTKMVLSFALFHPSSFFFLLCFFSCRLLQHYGAVSYTEEREYDDIGDREYGDMGDTGVHYVFYVRP
jgi:hypothetical protein